MTIEQLEQELQRAIHDALRPLIPRGYRPRVTLYGPQRKKKKTAEAGNWSPESDQIRISFDPVEGLSSRDSRSTASPAAPDPLADLIHALDHAESRPGFDFVAFKWFRDTALPAEGYAWAQSDSARQEALRDAIEKRFILTSKIPNPRAPQFPVTSIRLNRLLPQVQAILGTSGQVEDFEPVAVRGEALSETVLRERR